MAPSKPGGSRKNKAASTSWISWHVHMEHGDWTRIPTEPDSHSLLQALLISWAGKSKQIKAATKFCQQNATLLWSRTSCEELIDTPRRSIAADGSCVEEIEMPTRKWSPCQRVFNSWSEKQKGNCKECLECQGVRLGQNGYGNNLFLLKKDIYIYIYFNILF